MAGLRCVIDTNVLVAALRSRRGASSHVLPETGSRLVAVVTTGLWLELKDVTGNVGIGTPTPTSKVEISGAQDDLAITGFQPFLTLRETGGGNKKSFMQGLSGDVGLVTNNGNAVILKDLTGNVGLGTPTPAHHLDINSGPG